MLRKHEDFGEKIPGVVIRMLVNRREFQHKDLSIGDLVVFNKSFCGKPSIIVSTSTPNNNALTDNLYRVHYLLTDYGITGPYFDNEICLVATA